MCHEGLVLDLRSSTLARFPHFGNDIGASKLPSALRALLDVGGQEIFQSAICTRSDNTLDRQNFGLDTNNCLLQSVKYVFDPLSYGESIDESVFSLRFL